MSQVSFNSTDFDHQLSMIQAQLHALMESVNRLAELKAKMKTGTLEVPLSAKELAARTGKSEWSINWMIRKRKIKGHFEPGTSNRVYFLSEYLDAIKKS